MSVTIRPLEKADYDQWYPLWQGYLTFYKSEVADEVTEVNFDRICDPDGDLYGFAAVDDDGRMLGDMPL